MEGNKKKHGFKKIYFCPAIKAKLPIEVGSEEVNVPQTIEIPMWIVLNREFKRIGTISNEELQKFESEFGELEVLKAEVEEKTRKKEKTEDERENKS